MELFDHVRIKKNGITGIIVDIFQDRFTVEADNEHNPEDESVYDGKWPLYVCSSDELEPEKEER